MAKPRAEPARGERGEYRRERTQFRSLLLKNPNYFGTFPESTFTAEIELSGNTFYEELTCVGFSPAFDLLEATVQIKRTTGYGGDLCAAGSYEYVRFYIDYETGAGWQDVGLASFNAHDIPNMDDCAGDPTKPLTYVVRFPHEPKRDWCGRPVMPNVRAILSWGVMPPPGQPNWNQVWGNTLDRHVLIKPRRLWLIDVVKHIGELAQQKVEIPEELKHLELVEVGPPGPPPPPELHELASMYGADAGAQEGKETAVEPHRFGFADIQAAIEAPVGLNAQALSLKTSQWQELGFDLSELLGALEDSKGNTGYEEVDCLGLDPNAEWLVASFTIKRPTGYNGTLCQHGSREYVAFWADWDNTCEWTYVGTASIDVHDIASIPPDGLHYWVGLPVNLGQYRRPCKEPKIGRIRAVLSWNAPPSTVDPEIVPYWGNRLDAHVQIKPGLPPSGNPEIDVIGGISVSQIDVMGAGTTLSGALFAEWGSPADPHMPSRQCPFGGRINVQADVPYSFAASGYKYRVVAKKVADPPGSETPVLTPFLTTSGIALPVWRTPDLMGYFDYLPPSQNIFNMLAWWETGTLGDDLWEIRLEMVDNAHNPLGATGWHRIQLDNTKPEAEISIMGGLGDCKDFDEGVTLTGTYVATDLHFGHFDLYVRPLSMSPNPVSPPGGVSATPASGSNWTLDTSSPNQMKACGYVVALDVYDRTIVGSNPAWHNARTDDVGFCLRKPGT